MELNIPIDHADAGALLRLFDLDDDDAPDLAKIRYVVETLIDHAADGVRRPGAWERGWVEQCFGDDWTGDLPGCPEPGHGHHDVPCTDPRDQHAIFPTERGKKALRDDEWREPGL